MKALAVVAIAVAAGVLVTALGIVLGGGKQAPAASAAPPSVVIEVFPSARGEVVLPANLAVQPGVPVKVTVLNHTEMVHSFMAPGLGVNQIIPLGTKASPSKTVFTITALKSGIFTWHCAVPCGDEYMGGHIYAFEHGPAVSGVHWIQAV